MQTFVLHKNKFNLKFFKKLIYIILLIILLIVLGGWAFMQQKKFGKAPSGARLERIKNSPNYKNGQFQNLAHTPSMAEDANFFSVMYRFFFDKNPNKIPAKAFEFKPTDLKNLPLSENVYVWMGHSSYFIQIDGKRFLIDPVLSGAASPIKSTTRAFQGADIYTPNDLPEIDYLIITHDHWDHLDYETVTELKPKIKQIITGLGTGEHLEYWGFPNSMITELDWFEEKILTENFKITSEPARNFSGRGLKRNGTLWSSFMLQTPSKTIYIGGDSGYDEYYKKLGEKYPTIDFAIIENGQYNKDWRYIHALPGEHDKIMTNLKAKNLIPVHNSKFKLALHNWEEPLEKIVEYKKGNYTLFTPKIGEKLPLDDSTYQTEKWWEKLH